MTAAPDTHAAPAVVCLGARGGCGASMLAGALALLWADAGLRPLLADLDLVRGDLAPAWSVPADRSVADLVPVLDELRPGHLRGAAFPHSSGVSLIAAPPAGTDPAAWPAAAGARLIRGAALEWDRVVADLGAGDGRVAAGAIRAAGHVIVVCPPTVAGARAARAQRERLRRLAAEPAMRVVIGPVTSGSELSARAFARASGLSVVASLPRSHGEALELSAGRIARARRRRLAGAVAEIAEVVA